ncbi:MAG: acyl-CoA dehydrogenase family protein, partial [Pseudomonadota bacterium]|nr:acyl-CoA dehydrogenase family protein [Pseudomonadota bacterium]
ATALGAAAAQSGPDRVRMTSAAKAQGILSSRFVAQNGVQLQGGMGMSEEVAVGRYFKRLAMFEPMFGDLAWHRARFAQAHQAA